MRDIPFAYATRVPHLSSSTQRRLRDRSLASAVRVYQDSICVCLSRRRGTGVIQLCVRVFFVLSVFKREKSSVTATLRSLQALRRGRTCIWMPLVLTWACYQCLSVVFLQGGVTTDPYFEYLLWRS